jgi:tetratricopeptide (TPR) repeat protein
VSEHLNLSDSADVAADRRLLPEVGGPAISAAEFDSERLAATVRYSWPVDRTLLGGLERIARRLMDRADVEPPSVLLPELGAFVQLLLELISRSQDAPIGAGLRTAASGVALASARLSWVAGKSSDTYRHYALGEVLAREAGAGTELAMIFIDKSEAAAQTARLDADLMRSLALADAAEQAAGGDALSGVLGWVYGERAVQHARLGSAAASSRDIDRLHSLRFECRPGDFNLFSPLESAWADQYAGACALTLGRPDEAITVYESVLSRTDTSLVWERSRAGVQLATAWVDKGELEQACALLIQTLPVIRASGNQRDLQAALRLRDRSQRGRSSLAWRRLDEVLREA